MFINAHSTYSHMLHTREIYRTDKLTKNLTSKHVTPYPKWVYNCSLLLITNKWLAQMYSEKLVHCNPIVLLDSGVLRRGRKIPVKIEKKNNEVNNKTRAFFCERRITFVFRVTFKYCAITNMSWLRIHRKCNGSYCSLIINKRWPGLSPPCSFLQMETQ